MPPCVDHVIIMLGSPRDMYVMLLISTDPSIARSLRRLPAGAPIEDGDQGLNTFAQFEMAQKMPMTVCSLTIR